LKMPYPEPKYKAHEDVGSLTYYDYGGQSSSKGKFREMFTQTVKPLYDYMRNNTFHFHGSSEGQDHTYKKDSALTSDGIVIHFRGNYESESRDVPGNMSFELLSFQTPVEKLRQELTDVVKTACREVRGK